MPRSSVQRPAGGSAWQTTSVQRETPATKASRDTARKIAHFKERDPSLRKYFEEAYGIAVFSNVGKATSSVGGAYGRGVVYGNFNFGAQTSVVVVAASASAETSDDSRLAVFTLIEGALMYEASIVGRKFGYASL